MSDNYDQYLDALQADEAPEEPREKPQRASKKPSSTRAARKSSRAAQAPPAPRDEPRGKRAKEGYEQVNASVPEELKATVFWYLKMNAARVRGLPEEAREGIPTSLSDLVEQLLTEWVDEQGGVLTPRRKKK